MGLLRARMGWVIGLLAVIALLDYLWIAPANQTYAKSYLNESIVLSASTYATCRVINGGVSSLQESSISISPWGVGIEYEAGQILDPINDAVERLSEACVHSMALLGVQRIVLGIINQYGVFPFYLALCVFLGCLLVGKGARFARLSGRLALLLLLLRVSTPVLCFLGSQLNHQYFDPRIEEQAGQLAEIRELAWAEFETDSPAFLRESSQHCPPPFSFARFFEADRKQGFPLCGVDGETNKGTQGCSGLFPRSFFRNYGKLNRSICTGDRKNHPSGHPPSPGFALSLCARLTVGWQRRSSIVGFLNYFRPIESTPKAGQ